MDPSPNLNPDEFDHRRSSSNSLWDDISHLLNSSLGEDSTQRTTLPKEVRKRLTRLQNEGQARWRKLVTGDANTRVRDHYKRSARKLVTGDPNLAIEDHFKTQPIVKLVDKFSFTFGLFGFFITEGIVLKLPEYYWMWYSVVMTGLLSLRVYSYVVKRWGFFMFDFCYFVVACNILNCLFFPSNAMFWKISFMFSNGPLLVAMLAWRNSLVFHSLDKMTSFYIHFLGALLTFLARWHPVRDVDVMCEERLSNSPSTTTVDATLTYVQCPTLTWTDAVVYPCVAYFAWQVLQIILTEGIFKAMINNDTTLQTSIRWLCKDKRNGMHILCKSVCRKIGVFGPTETFDGDQWKSKLIFWVAQFIYTLVTLVPGIIVYHNYWLNVVWLLFVMTGVTWNGASFYIEVFAERYRLQFANEKAGKGSANSSSSSSSSSSYRDPDVLPESPPASPLTKTKKT